MVTKSISRIRMDNCMLFLGYVHSKRLGDGPRHLFLYYFSTFRCTVIDCLNIYVIVEDPVSTQYFHNFDLSIIDVRLYLINILLRHSIIKSFVCKTASSFCLFAYKKLNSRMRICICRLKTIIGYVEKKF